MTNSTKEIRRAFLDYFKSNGHEELSSSPLIPQDDPTLLFTNAGMVQFKNIFTGKENAKYNRATTSQKCLRAGGKHNDLENVGYTARHHTFFEMLGNFSFGDYFKELAIEYAWNLVTKIYNLDPKKILVTVYSEDEKANNLWKKISGLPQSRIIKISSSDNFWSMGDIGPCGPCSEIFYDHGSKIQGGVPGSKNEDGDRFIEIWNLVFMQYEMLSDGNRINLPKPSIDTGMGLERMAAVLQGVHNNYDIDLFKELINSSIDYSGVEVNNQSLISDSKLENIQLRAETLRLREAAEWGLRVPWRTKLAQVIGRDSFNWWRRVKLNLGSQHGIRSNQPVVSIEGNLIGRISEVGLKTSWAVLVGDPNCSFSALIKSSRQQGGIVSPKRFNSNYRIVELTYLPNDIEVRPGNVVVTSGLGGAFPKEIPVGQVEDSWLSRDGLYLEAKIKIHADLNRLEEVRILTDY